MGGDIGYCSAHGADHDWQHRDEPVHDRPVGDRCLPRDARPALARPRCTRTRAAYGGDGALARLRPWRSSGATPHLCCDGASASARRSCDRAQRAICLGRGVQAPVRAAPARSAHLRGRVRHRAPSARGSDRRRRDADGDATRVSARACAGRPRRRSRGWARYDRRRGRRLCVALDRISGWAGDESPPADGGDLRSVPRGAGACNAGSRTGGLHRNTSACRHRTPRRGGGVGDTGDVASRPRRDGRGGGGEAPGAPRRGRDEREPRWRARRRPARGDSPRRSGHGADVSPRLEHVEQTVDPRHGREPETLEDRPGHLARMGDEHRRAALDGLACPGGHERAVRAPAAG